MNDRIAEAAGLLVAAYRNNTPIAALPETAMPRDLEETYAVQNAIIMARGGHATGWKASGSPPTCAPVFEVFQSGASLDASRLHALGGEVEFGFQLTADLPPRATPYSDEEVFSKLAFVPLIEVIASRYVDRRSRSKWETLADSNANGAFVIGAPVANWRSRDFKGETVELAYDGTVVQSATGTHPHANPAEVVVWLANHLTGRTGGLKKGDVVTTGALKGATPAKKGQKAVGTWSHGGRVEVTFV